MPVTRDIAATYRRPGKVMRHLLAMGQREDRALAILMAACVVVFIGQWPRLAREAHVTGQELNALLGGTLLAWVFMAPLLFYAIAFVSYLALRAIGGQLSGFDARITLFWAFLAASPLILLHGLVAGFIGPGVQLHIVGAIWLALFLWFWIAGLKTAGWGRI
ncbi:MAG: YIP1 family protein [Roseovarius sp.]|nr:YIP1 family protein [Roseovarius sp.]